MNLLEVSNALSDVGQPHSFFYSADKTSHAQLERVKWKKSRLKDPTMLPLGIDPTCSLQSLTVDKTPIPVPR